MAILKCKGMIVEQEIASVYTPLAQIIGLDLPESESETFEADTLDNANAGIPYRPTGRSEGGSFGGELFLDPGLPGHQALLDLLSAPALQNWRVKFADAGPTTWPFSGAGFSLGATAALNDGLKAKFSVKLNGLPTYP